MAQSSDRAIIEDDSGLWQRYKWLLIGGAALILGLLAGWAIINLIGTPYTYHGTVIQSPEPDRNFALTGPDGRQVNLTDFRGQAVLLYFGYTFCPDVCPATMVELAQAIDLMTHGLFLNTA